MNEINIYYTGPKCLLDKLLEAKTCIIAYSMASHGSRKHPASLWSIDKYMWGFRII